jgi:hypothetical protein
MGVWLKVVTAESGRTVGYLDIASIFPASSYNYRVTKRRVAVPQGAPPLSPAGNFFYVRLERDPGSLLRGIAGLAPRQISPSSVVAVLDEEDLAGFWHYGGGCVPVCGWWLREDFDPHHNDDMRQLLAERRAMARHQ